RRWSGLGGGLQGEGWSEQGGGREGEGRVGEREGEGSGRKETQNEYGTTGNRSGP
ncbi:hypothetical protein Pcinc_038755, partial [Petrolisthes cinctipes]